MKATQTAYIQVSEADVETLLMALRVAENETFGIDRKACKEMYDNILNQASCYQPKWDDY